MKTERIRLDERATLYKRPDRRYWYLDLTFMELRRRISLKTSSKKKALEIAREMVDRARREKWQIPYDGKISFDEALDIYLAEHAEVRNAPSTVRINKDTLLFFYNWLKLKTKKDHLYLHSITSFHFNEYIRYQLIERKLSPATINLQIRVFMTFFNILIKKKYLQSNPVSSDMLLKIDKKIPKTLSTEAIEQILQKALEPREVIMPQHGTKVVVERDRTLYNLILFILNTGARLGEALFLKKEDIDMTQGIITFRSKPEYKLKDRQERAIRMNATTRKVVEEQAANNKTDWIFPTKGARPLDRSEAFHRLKNIAAKAGFPEANFQMMRRTFATLNSRIVKEPFVLQYMMGHASVTTTQDFYIGNASVASEPVEVRYKHE